MSAVVQRNLLLAQETDNQSDTNQNPCHIGIYATEITVINDSVMGDNDFNNDSTQPQTQIKFHLVSIQPIPAKIGYIEWIDTSSFLTLRSILLQQQPTTCVLYTTYDLDTTTQRDLNKDGINIDTDCYTTNQAPTKIIDSIENELTMASCHVIRHPLELKSMSSQQLKLLLNYHFTPASLAVSGNINNDDNPSTTTSTTTTRSRSIYPDSQITQSYQSFQTLLQRTIQYQNNNNNDDNIPLGICSQLLRYRIILPLREFKLLEPKLSSANDIQSRTQLKKLTKIALQLPLQLLFVPIQICTRLRVDQNTLSSIGVFAGPNDPIRSTTSNTTLYGLLNTCQTNFGSRLLRSWLTQPLLDIYEINARQLIVRSFVERPECLLKLRQLLRGIADIEKIIAKLNKIYTTTNNGTDVTKVNSSTSSNIIKELLALFYFLSKMRAILALLSSMQLTPNTNTTQHNDEMGDNDNDNTTSNNNTNINKITDEEIESSIYDIVTGTYTTQNDDGELIEGVSTIYNLKLEQLLEKSIHMTPIQFIQYRYTRELNRIISVLDRYAQLIEATIDLNAAAHQEFLIKPDITPELDEISKRRGKIHRGLMRLHQEVIKDLHCDEKTVKMMHTDASDIGYHLRVTRKDEKLIRNSGATYSVLETRKDGVRFTTTNFRKLSEQYQFEIAKYQQTQAATSLHVLDAGMSYCSDFNELMIIVAELDVLSSFAHNAVNARGKYTCPQLISKSGISIGPELVSKSTTGQYLARNVKKCTVSITGELEGYDDDDDEVKPKFDFSKKFNNNDTTTTTTTTTELNDNNTNEQLTTVPGHIILNGARHPTIEVQPGIVFIPNDVYLAHGETELQLITGPNMGGKSCYLRTAALIVLMAQIGTFVPCDSASICIVDCILARVGAGDMQLKGVSTFMREMLETGEILTHGSPNSLIVVDELGRGTSTYDGFGLAWGIAEYLATKIRSYTLFATHFHELTAISEQFPTITNKHVTALTGDNSITMLYKVQDGVCDRSFGIHVAQMANFPNEIIQLARQKADALEAYAAKNLLQLTLPIKYELKDKTVNISNNKQGGRITEDMLLQLDAEDENNDNNDGMNDNNQNNNNNQQQQHTSVRTQLLENNQQTNTFAMAMTKFNEKQSKMILENVFQNNDFITLVQTEKYNHNDPNQVKIIEQVYNTTVETLLSQP